MIYWGYVNKPKPEPEPAAAPATEPVEEKEYRIDWGAVKDTLFTIGLALFFILAMNYLSEPLSTQEYYHTQASKLSGIP